jgi:plasmid maintenance system antidote protein VapI
VYTICITSVKERNLKKKPAKKNPAKKPAGKKAAKPTDRDRVLIDGVAQELERLRRARGYSFGQAASLLGCTRGRIQSLERGDRDIQLGTLWRVLDAYGESPWDFLLAVWRTHLLPMEKEDVAKPPDSGGSIHKL